MRSVISVRGKDASKLLQSLCTNDIHSWSSGLLATAFLTTKGRILCDTILHKRDESTLVDVATSQKTALLRHLKMYKLRSDVTIEETPFFVSTLQGEADPRCAELRREISTSEVPDPSYTRRRMELGIGEGAEIAGRIPLTCNLDALNFISFTKGCYLGQELTARAKHRGTVRRRIVPLKCPSVEVGTTLTADGDDVGELLAIHDDRGLATLRLDAVDASTFALDGHACELLLPPWLDTIIRSG